jgi:hypothetical protein
MSDLKFEIHGAPLIRQPALILNHPANNTPDRLAVYLNRFVAAGNPQLAINIGKMKFHRPHADVYACRDFLVDFAVSQIFKHFPLSRCEYLKVHSAGGRPATDILGQQVNRNVQQEFLAIRRDFGSHRFS